MSANDNLGRCEQAIRAGSAPSNANNDGSYLKKIIADRLGLPMINPDQSSSPANDVNIEDDYDDSKSAHSNLSNASGQTDANTSSILYPHIPGAEPAKMVLLPLKARLTEDAGRLSEPVISYYAEINIGNPQQTFKVQFDLALNDNFLPHYPARWRPFNSGLHYCRGYSASKSRTSSKGNCFYSMRYNDCEFLGKLHEDNVRFNSFNRVKQEVGGSINYRKSSLGVRMNFLAIDVIDRDYFARLPIHGMFALGPKIRSDQIGCRNLLLKFQEESLIDRLFFSLWFDAKQLRGQMLFGGYDPKRFKGRIYWHDSGRDSWTLKLVGLSIGTSQIEQGLPCVAQLSSGINQIQAPISAIERIYSFFKTYRDPKTGLTWVRSDNYQQLPDIIINTEQVQITLEPTVYLGKIRDRYFLQIVPGSNDREWILGTMFLENVYSVYDLNNHKIGLARKRTTPIENFRSLACCSHESANRTPSPMTTKHPKILLNNDDDR